EHGQGTIEELRNRHFRKELEEREWIDKDKGSSRRAIEPSRESTASSAKRRKLDQVPFASLDALDDEESDSEDDTAALLAELQRIKKAGVAEQAKKVCNIIMITQ
ncbi:CW15A protein, partial [Acromyrmex heyeri]